MAVSPANTLRRAWRAVWWVRSRELHLNLGFWLVLLGYNPRKREIENPLYMVYALVFLALWGFMVLLLLADYAGQGLQWMKSFGTPAQGATAVGVLAWLVLLLVSLRSAVQRSPAVFSDADAHLLVMSPVNRRVVGLAWFAEAWLARALWVWPVAVVLGYALIEATTPVELTAGDLPRYLLAGLRMLAVGLPLHLAADGLAWAAGAWRLQGSRDRPGLRYLAPVLALLLLAGGSLLGPRLVSVLWPLSLVLRAGLSLAPLGAGLLAAWLLATAGLLLLWQTLPGLSLARAAQETRVQVALQAAAYARNQSAHQDIAQRNRLGASQSPARFLFRRGVGVLISRNLIQGARTFQAGDLLTWLGLGALPLALALIPDWGVQVWAALAWVLLLNQKVEQALRATLSRWWLLRGLPFRSEAVVLAELALPVVGAWLAVLAGLLVTALVPSLSLATWTVLLVFPGALGIALAAAADQLRQVKSSQVLAGFAPGVSLLGMLLAMLAIGLPAGIYFLATTSWGLTVPGALGMMLIASLTINTMLWQWAGALLRDIK